MTYYVNGFIIIPGRTKQGNKKMNDRDQTTTPVLEKNTSNSKSAVSIISDGTETRESKATVSVTDAMGNTKTNSVSVSDGDTTGEDTENPTDTLSGADGDTTGEDTENPTDTLSGADGDTTGEDTENPTDTLSGADGDTTGEDTENPTDIITDLTNTAAAEDVSQARRTESSELKPLILESFINNGSFEGNSFEPSEGTFENWRTIGDTRIETEEIGIAPTDGESQALITNGFSDAGGSVEESDLSEFLDLTSGSLDALLEGNATEGSGIKQTFTAQAGDILEFDYRLLTNEATPSTTFNDSAFFALGKSVDNPLDQPVDDIIGNSVRNFGLELADTFDTTFSEDNQLVEGYSEATDGKTVRVAISEAGTYELGFGIVDLSDSIVDSGLLLDDVKLIPTGAADPFSLPSVDGSGGDVAISSEVDFTFGTNGFEATSGSSNPQQ
jgi:hypothetical protein